MTNLVTAIGKIISNDGTAIKVLFGQETKHIGNFNFTAEVDGREIIVITAPVDDNFDYIKIMDIQ